MKEIKDILVNHYIDSDDVYEEIKEQVLILIADARKDERAKYGGRYGVRQKESKTGYMITGWPFADEPGLPLTLKKAKSIRDMCIKISDGRSEYEIVDLDE